MRIIYLHGFASSPASVKAQRFVPLLEGLGLSVSVPDLNEPCFETLSLSRSVGRVLDLARRPEIRDIHSDSALSDLIIIGSSFGGLTAAMSAQRLGARVAGLVLMAPAFDLAHIWDRELGAEGLEEWKMTNRLEVDHPAYVEPKYLHWAFYEDAVRHDTSPMQLSCPCLVFHGLDDDVVDPAVTRDFFGLNPSAQVHFLHDGHDLLSSLDFILEETRRFLMERVGISSV